MTSRRATAGFAAAVLALALSLSPGRLGGSIHAAGLDPEVNEPYHLKVVLHIAKHPLLTGTDVFKNQVTRELRDGLRAALGSMGHVEIMDQHPLLPAIEQHGLGHPLDGLKKVSDAKTHFVLIDFVNGQYEIQARQHDGLTGLVSPVIRRMRTTDRQFVARAATLLIHDDLGVVGTLEDKPKGDDVRITLKGSGLGQPMDRWVKKDDVFAVVRLSRAGNEWRSERLEWALLQVKDGPNADGTCGCRFYHRYANPLRGGAGFRCIKLGTTAARLSLRLVDKAGRPLSDQPVEISHVGFQSGKKVDGLTDADGYVSPQEPFTNIAFVSVMRADTAIARIPVEIMDDRTVTCEIDKNPDDENKAQYQLHRRQFERKVNEGISMGNGLFADIKALSGRKEYAKTLEVARKGVEALREEVQARTRELGLLRDEAKQINFNDRALSDAGIRALEKQAKELEEFAKKYEAVVQRQNDPRRQEMMAKVEQARQNELAVEIDEAIAAYREAAKLAEAINEPKYLKFAREKYETLSKAWATKNEEHARAREFIKNKWPKYDVSDLKEGVGQARAMFEICKKYDDKLTPQRMLKANVVLANRITKVLEPLDPKRDRDTIEPLLKVADDLQKLTNDALAYVNSKAKPEDEEPD